MRKVFRRLSSASRSLSKKGGFSAESIHAVAPPDSFLCECGYEFRGAEPHAGAPAPLPKVYVNAVPVWLRRLLYLGSWIAALLATDPKLQWFPLVWLFLMWLFALSGAKRAVTERHTVLTR